MFMMAMMAVLELVLITAGITTRTRVPYATLTMAAACRPAVGLLSAS